MRTPAAVGGPGPVECRQDSSPATASSSSRPRCRNIVQRAHSALSSLGLLSEDYVSSGLRMWGNFPQAYSHVGLIHAAFTASPCWAGIL
jgi:GH15 family glucan-1,4-alpha-glucosidase